MSAMRLAALGKLEITYDGQPVTNLTSLKARALLVYLAVTGESHSRQALAGLLWPDVLEHSALTSLRTALSQIRKSLGELVLADRHTAGLNPDSALTVDVRVFEETCRRIRAGDLDDPATVRELRAAVDLYRDAFLAGFPETDSTIFEEWVTAQREHMHRLAIEGRQRLAENALAQKQYERGIEDALAAVELDPLYEPAHRALMALYVAAGRRVAALRQYEACASLLGEELGVTPSQETVALYEEILRENSRAEEASNATSTSPAVAERASAPRHNLPAQTTPFLGRETELAELFSLLDTPEIRLLTIMGPGGMGKSRLAQQVGETLLPSYAQGVFYVELAPLAEAHDIPAAVAGALNVSTQSEERSLRQQVLAYLSQREVLLILDNFEHLLEGADFVHELLQTAPQVKVLVTSRQRLRLSGETVFSLSGMPVPEDPASSAEEPKGSSVELFVQCAQRVDPAFHLDTANAQSVAAICRQVHGMPLAIVLASAWLDTLSPQEIAAEIGDSLEFLQSELRDLPERQRSIHAVFAASWQRLGEEERSVFMRLSVFLGGFTRAAAQTVADASLPILSALTGASLLQRDSTVAGRYQVHELLRQFAEEHLRAAGLWDSARAAHSGYFADFLSTLEQDLKGRRQLGALNDIEADWENVRAAWRWAVRHADYDAVGRSLESLYWYCHMRSRLPAGQEMLQLARQELAPRPDDEPHPVWGRLLSRAMKTNVRYLEPADEVAARVKAALEIAQKNGDRREIAFCLWALGMVFVSKGDPVSAIPYFEQSLEQYRVLGDSFYTALVLYYLGLSHTHARVPENGELALSLEIRRSLGDRVGTAYSLSELGDAWWITDVIDLSTDQPAADIAPDVNRDPKSHLEHAFAIHKEMGNQQGMSEVLVMLAVHAVRHGEPNRVDALAGEIGEIADATGSVRHKGLAEQFTATAAYLRGDYALSRQHNERAMAYVSGQDHQVVSVCEFWLSVIAVEHGEYRSAEEHFRRSLAGAIRSEQATSRSDYLIQAARLLVEAGHAEWAASVLALAVPRAAAMRDQYQRLQERLKAQLPPSDFAAAWRDGRSRSWEAVRDELLAEL